MADDAPCIGLRYAGSTTQVSGGCPASRDAYFLVGKIAVPRRRWLLLARAAPNTRRRWPEAQNAEFWHEEKIERNRRRIATRERASAIPSG